MDASIATSASSQLVNLPQEIRYRTYDFAFHQALFHVSEEADSEEFIRQRTNFPIAFAATCRLLQAEVEQYLATYLHAVLLIDTTKKTQVIPRDIIPERYLLRVERLFTNVGPIGFHQKLFESCVLPELQRVDIQSRSMSLEGHKTLVDDLFATEAKNQYQHISCTVEKLLDDNTELQDTVRSCHEKNMRVAVHILVCVGEDVEHSIRGLFEIVVHAIPGEENQIVSTSKEFAPPKTREEVYDSYLDATCGG